MSPSQCTRRHAHASHSRPRVPAARSRTHTQPQPKAKPQSTSPVRLIENHQNGKGVLGQTKKNPRTGKKAKIPRPQRRRARFAAGPAPFGRGRAVGRPSAVVAPLLARRCLKKPQEVRAHTEVQALSRGEMESNERVAAIVTSTVLVPAPGSRRSSRTQPLAVSRQPNARSSNPVNNLLTMSTISQREWITVCWPNTRIWKTGTVITCNYTVITAL